MNPIPSPELSNAEPRDTKKPMKAPVSAITPHMTEAEENRFLDFILRGGKVREGQQLNLEPK